MRKSARQIKRASGLEVGMMVEIVNTDNQGKARKRSGVFKGKIVEIPNVHYFQVVSNLGIRDSFNFKDIGIQKGIAVKVIS